MKAAADMKRLEQELKIVTDDRDEKEEQMAKLQASVQDLTTQLARPEPIQVHMIEAAVPATSAAAATAAAAPNPPPQPALWVGAEVEIHSVQKSPELNGVRGEIVKPQDLGTGRWEVKATNGRLLALKPVNLRLPAPTIAQKIREQILTIDKEEKEAEDVLTVCESSSDKWTEDYARKRFAMSLIVIHTVIHQSTDFWKSVHRASTRGHCCYDRGHCL